MPKNTGEAGATDSESLPVKRITKKPCKRKQNELSSSARITQNNSNQHPLPVPVTTSKGVKICLPVRKEKLAPPAEAHGGTVAENADTTHRSSPPVTITHADKTPPAVISTQPPVHVASQNVQDEEELSSAESDDESSREHPVIDVGVSETGAGELMQETDAHMSTKFSHDDVENTFTRVEGFAPAYDCRAVNEYAHGIDILDEHSLVIVADKKSPKKMFVVHKAWVDFCKGYVFVVTARDASGQKWTEVEQSHYEKSITLSGVMVGTAELNLPRPAMASTESVAAAHGTSRGRKSRSADCHVILTWKPYHMKCVLQAFSIDRYDDAVNWISSDTGVGTLAEILTLPPPNTDYMADTKRHRIPTLKYSSGKEQRKTNLETAITATIEGSNESHIDSVDIQDEERNEANGSGEHPLDGSRDDDDQSVNEYLETHVTAEKRKTWSLYSGHNQQQWTRADSVASHVDERLVNLQTDLDVFKQNVGSRLEKLTDAVEQCVEMLKSVLQVLAARTTNQTAHYIVQETSTSADGSASANASFVCASPSTSTPLNSQLKRMANRSRSESPFFYPQSPLLSPLPSPLSSVDDTPTSTSGVRSCHIILSELGLPMGMTETLVLEFDAKLDPSKVTHDSSVRSKLIEALRMFNPMSQGGSNSFSALMRLMFTSSDGMDFELKWFQRTQLFALLCTYTSHWDRKHLPLPAAAKLNEELEEDGEDGLEKSEKGGDAKSHVGRVKAQLTRWLKAEKSSLWRARKKINPPPPKVTTGTGVTESPVKKRGKYPEPEADAEIQESCINDKTPVMITESAIDEDLDSSYAELERSVMQTLDLSMKSSLP